MSDWLNDLAARIPDLHDAALAEWAVAAPVAVDPGPEPASLVRAQHYCNHRLWALEAHVRCPELSAEAVAAAKRTIDAVNQRRNDLAEALDERLLAALADVDTARAELHSETAGMMIDRLSILALKIRHAEQHAARDDDPALATECAARARLLGAQRADLAGCLVRLVADFRAGRRYFKRYRQLKTYNDPRFAGAG